MPLLTTLKHRLFPPIPIPPDVALRTTILRRQRVLDKLSLAVPWIRTALILAGFAYLLALPFPGEGRGKQGGFLGRGHYVSENALQPGQVSPEPRLVGGGAGGGGIHWAVRADRPTRVCLGQHVLELG